APAGARRWDNPRRDGVMSMARRRGCSFRRRRDCAPRHRGRGAPPEMSRSSLSVFDGATRGATAIRELPSAERLRHLGAQALSTAELLALLIGSGGAGRSALAVGQALLASAGGSLRRLAS